MTQVVNADEGHIFHNRLTHSLEVSQVARRLAEHLVDTSEQQLLEEYGLIDCDAVEAAALAHDLGHPPFGHVSESELDRIITNEFHDDDGFEGNAQSFRVVTKLACRKTSYIGLNLTRVTLNGILKYPWQRQANGHHSRKWGAYQTETNAFNWTRDSIEGQDRTIEASIMNIADDIAYAIHDMEDFYRAGLIPLERLAESSNDRERRIFLDAVFRRWEDEERPASTAEKEQLSDAFNRFCRLVPIRHRYSGTRSERVALRSFTSYWIGQYIKKITLTDNPSRPLKQQKAHEHQIRMLKELTWHYVINNPGLAVQQAGFRRIIRDLAIAFMDAACNGPKQWKLLPPRYQQELRELQENFGGIVPATIRVRTVADAVAGLTDLEALRLHQRLMGIRPGSILDSIAY